MNLEWLDVSGWPSQFHPTVPLVSAEQKQVAANYWWKSSEYMTHPTCFLGWYMITLCSWQIPWVQTGDVGHLDAPRPGLGTSLPTIFAARALDGFFCGNMGAAPLKIGNRWIQKGGFVWFNGSTGTQVMDKNYGNDRWRWDIRSTG